jgi:hypothetical protein
MIYSSTLQLQINTVEFTSHANIEHEIMRLLFSWLFFWETLAALCHVMSDVSNVRCVSFVCQCLVVNLSSLQHFVSKSQ